MKERQQTAILSVRFQDAMQLALFIHKDQIRKSSGAPYTSHLLNVCGLVLSQGGDEDEAIAALLHDSLEDHPDKLQANDIQDRFGPRVLSLVLECTDTPPNFKGGIKPPWAERKQAFFDRLKHSQLDSHHIILADKLDNLRSTLHAYKIQGEDVWSCFRAPREQQLWYFQSFCKIMRGKGVNSPLLDDYEQILKELIFLLRKKVRVA